MSPAAPQDNRSPRKRAAERSESRGRGRKKHSPEKPRQSGSDAFEDPGMTRLPGSRHMGTSSSPSKGSQPGDSHSTDSQAGRKREPQARNPTPGGPKPGNRKSNDTRPSTPLPVFNFLHRAQPPDSSSMPARVHSKRS